jgi:ubiquinone/menaquinone biosynthesis C-methylase UbiE
MTYEVLEVSLGSVSRLYQYKLSDIYGAHFNLKGFDYPWADTCRTWKKGEKVLDVGAAYSPLPLHIHETYGCEVWVADDYGLKSGQPFWTRGNSPQEYVVQHPEIKFVLERLGDPKQSSLPEKYFDIIYSISALEHVPQSLTQAVWRHIDLLLKPGGELIHAVDIGFPSNRGLAKVLAAELFDMFYFLSPAFIRVACCMATPKAYARLALKTLGVTARLGDELSVLNMVLNPDILTEGYKHGFNRILKDGMTDYCYQRAGTLLLRLRKRA